MQTDECTSLAPRRPLLPRSIPRSGQGVLLVRSKERPFCFPNPNVIIPTIHQSLFSIPRSSPFLFPLPLSLPVSLSPCLPVSLSPCLPVSPSSPPPSSFLSLPLFPIPSYPTTQPKQDPPARPHPLTHSLTHPRSSLALKIVILREVQL